MHAQKQVVQSVLVVDDDPNIRKMIIAALRREGYEFAEAPNGKEALEIMRAQRPDVVVLDLMMPIVSGWEVLQERENDPQEAAFAGSAVVGAEGLEPPTPCVWSTCSTS